MKRNTAVCANRIYVGIEPLRILWEIIKLSTAHVNSYLKEGSRHITYIQGICTSSFGSAVGPECNAQKSKQCEEPSHFLES